MSFQIFIDGQEGTTGLEISELVAEHEAVTVIDVDSDLRKDPAYRTQQYQRADLVILCLPDQAAKESVSLSSDTRFIDASTSHRTAEGWTYGLPELCAGQRDAISQAQYVSNPGCYPTGFLLAVRPLIDDGLISKDQILQIHAVSGYSGGGKKLINAYADDCDKLPDTRLYSLDLQHKHLPEMQRYARLIQRPIFLPAVGPFYRGMTVNVALVDVDVDRVNELWHQRYDDEPFVDVLDWGHEGTLENGFLSAMRCNHTNRLDLLATSNGEQTLLCAVLDNLGKGASQAAVQNLNLMLGLNETIGLKVK